MQPEISYIRGTVAGTGVTILLTVFGFAFFYLLFTNLWLMGIISVPMLLTAFCLTGIEFNTEEKKYREFYQFLFYNFGKWHSYKDFKFVSFHDVSLAGSVSFPYVYKNIETHYGESSKIILLNQNHSAKLFIVYSGDLQKTKETIDELITKLDLPFAKFSPPVSQARLKRKK